MRYAGPELDYVRFENADVLTDSDELPIVPAEAGDDTGAFGDTEGYEREPR